MVVGTYDFLIGCKELGGGGTKLQIVAHVMASFALSYRGVQPDSSKIIMSLIFRLIMKYLLV